MILNIYCGVRSIGWNITAENRVIDFGVKRVNVDFDSYYAFIAGLPVAKRTDRRMKRAARRNLWRWKTRKNKLISLLKSDSMYPEDYLLKSDRHYLNTLRNCACLRPISKQEVGRVLLDLQAKRGYKSMRGVDDTGDSEYLETIAMHEAALQNYSSVGEYFNTLETTRNVILRRETYIKEFQQICEVQGLDYNRYFGAIFYQRPLKKGKIGFCKLERNRKVTHQSNPAYQRFRILRDVNNIEIFDTENNVVEISDENRQKFIEILWSGKDLTKAGTLKIMGIKKPSLYKWFMGQSIAGNMWGKILGAKEYHPIPNGFIMSVWQDLISATDDNLLINILQRKYAFGFEQASEIAAYDIKSAGYSEYSEKAIKKLTPIMGNGSTLNESILAVYGKVDFGGGVHLRNVVLEQVYTSAESLVKAIQAKYSINTVQIEIDRLLKMGNKSRKASASNQRKQVKENTELDKRIAEFATPTDYNRQKLRLWDEMNGRSPYFPEVEIPLQELFTDKYNLDHIVPKSKLMDFSNDNLVLCPAKFNTQKNRTTGVEFAENLNSKDAYVSFVNAAKISERKRNLLLMKETDIPTDYVSRSAGTDYNTGCFLTLHKNAVCIPNKLVNMYAKQWKMNQYGEFDVRNSLEKSFVIANMSRETLEYFDNIRLKTAGTTSVSAYNLTPELSCPDLSNVIVYCPKTKFFRRTKFGYTSRFSLHKESIFGQRKRIFRNGKGELKTEIFYKIRQPIGKLTPNMVANISDQAIKRIVKSRLDKFSTHEEGMQDIIENPLMFNGKPIRAVSVSIAGQMLIPLHSAENGITRKNATFERKVDYVYSSMNYSLELVDGKRVTRPLIKALEELNAGTFQNRGFHKQDPVMYEGKQYIISGLDDSGIALRSAYTLLAENAMKLTKPTEIAKLVPVKTGQIISHEMRGLSTDKII